MLFESSFLTVLGISLLILVIFVIVYKFRSPIPKNDLEKALLDLKIALITIGSIAVVMIFMLPFPSFLNPPILSETVGAAEANQRILAYAKDIAFALERIISILYFFLLFFVAGFIVAIYQAIKASGYLKKQEGEYEAPEA